MSSYSEAVHGDHDQPLSQNEHNCREKPRLLDQVRDAIRLKHYSIRTEQAYVDWIKRYIYFHKKRHPAELDENHITSFLTYLAVQKKVASSTQNQMKGICHGRQ